MGSFSAEAEQLAEQFRGEALSDPRVGRCLSHPWFARSVERWSLTEARAELARRALETLPLEPSRHRTWLERLLADLRVQAARGRRSLLLDDPRGLLDRLAAEDPDPGGAG